MFKSIQWKLVLLYLLLVVFIITIIGVMLLRQVEDLYYDNFRRGIATGMKTVGFSKVTTDAKNLDELKTRVKSYYAIFLIDGFVRNMYILDNWGVVKEGTGPQIEIDKKSYTDQSSNVLRAIRGQAGDEINRRGLLDYAQPVVTQDGGKYIVYVTDNKIDLNNILYKIKKAIVASILLSLLVSTILGFLFARTITVPIKNLAEKARKIADGDFEQKIEEKSQDEIGQLTKDFNHMAFELKNTLSEISSEKSKVEAILSHMTDGVMAFDHEGSIIHVNPAAKKIVNYKLDESNFNEIFAKIGVDVSLGDFVYLEDDSVRERKVQIGDSYIRLYFVSFKGEGGKIGGVIVVLQDITEQERLDNMRREFVANVSHELRTPLTTIKSYIETLLDGAVEDKETTSEFLQVIDTESDRMARLVKDLLQLSRIDYQQVEWRKESVNLDSMIKGVLKKINIEAKNKNQTVEYFVTSNVPEIYADKDRIEQVVLNIVSNAIKYTQESGKISIYLGAMFNEAYIKVIDNGMGIPKKDLSRVFERFYRVDKARTREQGGTGLGLAIAKEIIEAHEGTIVINSQLGQGTEVVINLPIA